MLMDRQTNRITPISKMNLVMMVIYLPSFGQSVSELESGNENVDGQMDRQTDVGHINLIGMLVKRNPPKNKFQMVDTNGKQ